MRRSARFQFLASATMSSRSSSRGGGRNQWRRTFSDRPYDGGRGHFVTGDSHFRSVRDSNLGYRQGSLSNRQNGQPPSFNPNHRVRYPPPPFNPNQQFRRPPPPSDPNQQFRHPPPPFNHQQFRYPPPINQNHAVRPRPPKPLDYRTWEYAKVAPPPGSERFVILSYNILADYLAISHRRELYFHIPRHILDWEWRKRSIIFELGLWSADIMCFQEVDRFQDLETELKLRGYSGIWKMRTGNAVDGCAIFWRTSRFKLLFEECIEFNKLGLRDNVAQICVLEMLGQNFNENGASPSTSSAHSNKVVVCNIHVLYNPKRGEIKLGQIRTLLDRAHAVSKIWNDAPLVLCGDFNCTPKSSLYNFISEQKLDISVVDRDKISGQASAQIRPRKSYNPNPRVQSADGSIQAPPVEGRVEVAIKPSDPLSDVQKDDKYGNAANTPFLSNSSPSESIDTLLNVSDNSCGSMQHSNEKSTLSDLVKKETHRTLVDDLKENPSYLQSKDRPPTDYYQIDDKIHKFSPPGASHPEEKSDVTEMGHREKVNAFSSLNHGSSSEHADSNFIINNDSSNCDDSTLSLLSNDHSSRAECNSVVMSASNSETYLSCMTSSSDAVDVSPGSSGKYSSPTSTDVKQDSCSTPYQLEVSSAPTSFDSVVADKLENLSMRDIDETRVEAGNIDEDDNTFLSALHNNEDTFPFDSDQFIGSKLDPSSEELGDEVLHDVSPALDSEAVDVENIAYDPSLWTPMEIATATGNADCTFLEHPLQLKSAYTEVEDGTGTRDSNGEPLVTSYNRHFMGTVDYIWHSSGIHTVRALAPMPKHAMQWTPGFPTKKWGSDHIALAAELVITKEW